MKVTSIRAAAPGERLLAVSPDMKPDLVVAGRRRVNYFTGRALSDVALNVEQQSRASGLTLLRRAVSPGVEFGLDVTHVAAQEMASAEFLITSGVGVTATGEDVVLPADLRIKAADCPVHPQSVTVPQQLQEQAVVTLGQFLAADGAAPRAAVLLLQAATFDERGEFNASSQCAEDPAQYAYEDWRTVDACHPVLFAWPENALPLPPPGPQFRNLLANALFEAERTRTAGELLPWESVGVPIALVAFDPDQPGAVLFADHHAVVRAGGWPRPRRSSAISAAGDPFLWKARREQFTAEVVEAALNGAGREELAGQFQFLPPVGVLPADLFEPREGKNHFFPEDYEVELRPAALEQLDAVIKPCAGLAGFDRDVPDRVRVLVPVPQAYYEPELLETAAVAPLFEETIKEYVARRGRWLRRRVQVREMQTALTKAITGKPPAYPDPDPEALEPDEAVAADPVDPTIPELSRPEAEYATEQRDGVRVSSRFEQLRTSLGKIQALITELPELSARGVEGFIEFLQQKIRQADDRVDLGFLQLQVDIYRIRQLILGTDAATRLATSPALASIAKGESAWATREDLAQFVSRIKGGAAERTALGSTQPLADSGAGAAGAEEAESALRAGIAQPLRLQPLVSDTFVSGTPVKAGVSPLLKPLTSVTQAPTVSSALTEAKLVDLQTATKAIAPAGKPAVSVDAVLQKPAIIGSALNFRTLTVAERIAEPPAAETKSFAVSTKADVVKGIAELGIAVDDLKIPGFLDAEGKETTLFVREIKARDVLSEITGNKHDPDPGDADESKFFSSAVRSVDHSTAMLRIIEGRVQVYRNAVAECLAALRELRASLSQAEQRLDVIGSELAEARHDVSVARALLAEETARIDSINRRRSEIVSKHVSFVLFHRPREATLSAALPARPLFPGLQEAPVPVCLKRDVPAPPELRAMVDLLRDVPSGWFQHIPPLLDRLDHVDLLRRTIVHSQTRAVSLQATSAPPATLVRTGRLAGPVQTVFQAQQQIILQQRIITREQDLTLIGQATWNTLRQRALECVSLGDLLDSYHGRTDVVRRTTEELDQIARVAACLYESFSGVTPRLRLEWAERLSQYDEPINLRNLSRLPRWGEIEFAEQRRMQGLADWLYGRVDARRAEAVALVSDLVRTSLLLASHAPVDEIIAGHVAAPTPAQVGRVVTLTIDPRRVRLGMPVAIYRAEQIVAHAVIDDLASDQASARIVSAMAAEIHLDQGARVRVGGAELTAGGKVVPRVRL